METIPPTRDALLQHCKRAAYQAGIWTTSTVTQQQIPSPEGNGWTLDGETNSWLLAWTNLEVASKACSELVKCSCRSVKGCGERCSCKKVNWKCTELCKCNCMK